MFSLQGLWDNFVFYLWLPASTFNGLPFSVIYYPLLLAFVVISAIRFGKRDLPIYGYCLATVSAFIIWPERQGLRFLYPVLPFLFIFAFCGMEQALSWLKTAWQKPAALVVTVFWVLLALVSMWVSVDLGRANLADQRTITGPFDLVSAQMFNFLRAKTPSDSVIVFFKPRAMHLMSGRNSFITDNCDQLAKGNYLAVSKKVEANGLIPLQELTSCDNVALKSIFENRRFIVYKIGQ